jgi:phosphatidylinositol-3-phosphatase
MKLLFKTFLALAVAAAGAASADEGKSPEGIRNLDHVFLIMMENHGYAEIVGNPSMPFTNQLAKSAALATNYYAVAHPSLTNYLEIVGGSNFGVLNDSPPLWHDSNCQTNLDSGTPALDNGKFPTICPFRGHGKDTATPAIDNSNLEGNGPGPVINIDGKASFGAAVTHAKSIAHQLVAKGQSWKTYQESLPPSGADGVNSADGLFSNLHPPINSNVPDSLLALYAVKHNPFAYFADIEQGSDPRLSLANVVSFDGRNGLFADLYGDHVPTFSYIVPNQCNDQHARSGAGPQCADDPNDNGTLVGLNPALMYQGDATLGRIVGAIKASPAWNQGRNAIVIVWDESDYSIAPITNQVTLIVATNDVGVHARTSGRFYTHFSLLKTLEGALGLPCLNHACDPDVHVMSDLFDGTR